MELRNKQVTLENLTDYIIDQDAWKTWSQNRIQLTIYILDIIADCYVNLNMQDFVIQKRECWSYIK